MPYIPENGIRITLWKPNKIEFKNIIKSIKNWTRNNGKSIAYELHTKRHVSLISSYA